MTCYFFIVNKRKGHTHARIHIHTHTHTNGKLLMKIYNHDGNDLGRSEKNDNSKLFSNHTEGVETTKYMGTACDWVKTLVVAVYI